MAFPTWINEKLWNFTEVQWFSIVLHCCILELLRNFLKNTDSWKPQNTYDRLSERGAEEWAKYFPGDVNKQPDLKATNLGKYK